MLTCAQTLLHTLLSAHNIPTFTDMVEGLKAAKEILRGNTPRLAPTFQPNMPPSLTDRLTAELKALPQEQTLTLKHVIRHSF